MLGQWWHEVQQGSYVFDRQEAEVAQLRSLKPHELLGFARELMGGGGSCRKLTMEVRERGAGSEWRGGTMGDTGHWQLDSRSASRVVQVKR